MQVVEKLQLLSFQLLDRENERFHASNSYVCIVFESQLTSNDPKMLIV